MFGLKHLEAIMFTVVVNIFIVKHLLRKQYSPKRVMLVFIAFFYLLEILKVLYFIIFEHGYPVSAYPFYLCSTPLYFMWVLVFSKNEKILHFFKSNIAAIFLTSGCAAMMYPSLIIGGDLAWSFSVENIRPAVSVLFHTFMIAVPLYMLATGYYKPKYKDVMYVEVLLLITMIFIYILNTIIDSDFFFLNRGEGSPIQWLKEISEFWFVFLTFFLHFVIIGGVSVVTTVISNKVQKKQRI